MRMSKSKKTYKGKTSLEAKQPTNKPVNKSTSKKSSVYIWILVAVGVTAVCFFPMLQNEFTNWDDEAYVINNPLLREPDWNGIFSKPVVSNYHPLTIISLAINYQLTQLDPSSYFLVNFLLHLINTALVFYLAWLISGKKLPVALLTSIVFGIHPLHVESVAWIAERKDVLYTFFFLLSLIQYWRFLETNRQSRLWFSFFLFVLSLLSKPAAIVLPLVLVLLDYWKGRKFNGRLVLEKIPFLLLAILFAVITLLIQSQKATASLEVFSVVTRMLFACYTIMMYFLRFFLPYPLSPFHPYPPADNLGLPVYLSPLFIIALLIFAWMKRKNKIIIFGLGFFVINLLLVTQIVSIGYTIISERYTYVPYIGLGFMFAMLLNKFVTGRGRLFTFGAGTIVLAIFGLVTFQQTKIWKNSETMWTAAIKYNDAPIPRTNRASYYYSLADSLRGQEANQLLEKAIEDCNVALQLDPHWQIGYETRGLTFVKLNKDKEALADGDQLVKQHPDQGIGYSIRGTAYMRLNENEKAISDFNIYLKMKPDDGAVYNKRGAIYYNYYQDYSAALADFSKAIQFNPDGSYYLNRSRCYYLLGNVQKAKEDALICLQKGGSLSAEYRKLLNL
jgi:protein O-mannosyl-transferase